MTERVVALAKQYKYPLTIAALGVFVYYLYRTSSKKESKKPVERRVLHWVFKLGDLKKDVELYTNILGMHVHRHEEFSEGCEATCNGPYAGAWSKTMIGYGSEHTNFALELTYNYGIDSYAQGNDLRYIVLEVDSVDSVLRQAKEAGYTVDEVNGFVFTNDRYRFKLVYRTKDRREPFRLVSLHVTDVKKSRDYYTSSFGMSVFSSKDVNGALKSDDSVLVGFSEDQTLIELVELRDAKLDHAKALGRIASAVEDNGPWTIGAKVREAGGKISHGPMALPPHGERVVVLQDFDGYEYAFVDARDYAKLCDSVKNKTIDWDWRAKKLSRADEDRDTKSSKDSGDSSSHKVHDVKNEEEYNELIKSKSHVFVDFNASWCKPCKKILPEIKKWSVQPEFEHVLFLSVDVEELGELSSKLEITQMPTFFFLHKGELVERMTGSYADPILVRLRKHAARKD